MVRNRHYLFNLWFFLFIFIFIFLKRVDGVLTRLGSGQGSGLILRFHSSDVFLLQTSQSQSVQWNRRSDSDMTAVGPESLSCRTEGTGLRGHGLRTGHGLRGHGLRTRHGLRGHGLRGQDMDAGVSSVGRGLSVGHSVSTARPTVQLS